MAAAVDAAAMHGVLQQHAVNMAEQRARYEHSNRELAAELARQQVAWWCWRWWWRWWR